MVGIVSSNSNCKDEMVKRLSSKNLNRVTGYLTPKARLAFNKLRKAFTETSILQNFNLEYHIQIKTNAPGYTISRVLYQLTLNNSGP